MKDTAISQMFKAFSDPTRLRIMHLLLDGEWCVGDLVELLEVPPADRLTPFAILARRRDGHRAARGQVELLSSHSGDLGVSQTPTRVPLQLFR